MLTAAVGRNVVGDFVRLAVGLRVGRDVVGDRVGLAVGIAVGFLDVGFGLGGGEEGGGDWVQPRVLT